jgi:hypothetical protein
LATIIIVSIDLVSAREAGGTGFLGPVVMVSCVALVMWQRHLQPKRR